MAEIFTVRWAGHGQSRREGSESAALALAFAKIREGDEAVSVRRPDGSEIGHEALLVMMAAD
jgi:hypothetical protein